MSPVELLVREVESLRRNVAEAHEEVGGIKSDTAVSSQISLSLSL
jgi:hypothetical protein